MDFATFGLHAILLSNLKAQGFIQPTPIQTEAIAPALSGRNLIGLAQTGTGKTAAFVLPIMHRLMAGRRGGVRALIVAPTRELAEQIHTAVRTLGVGSGLRSAVVYGGVGMGPQEQALRNGVDILVACPGRLLDHLGRGSVRLDRVETLVLDEADRMLDMGFLPAIRRLLSALPVRRQTMLFSATLPPELRDLVATTAPDALTVQIGTIRPAHTVAHAIYPVAGLRKTALLIELLHEVGEGSVLVFTRTKHRANRLFEQVNQAGYRAAALHGNRSQNQRQAAIDAFRSGRIKVLVATDIAARGLDIDRVSHVINYDIPDTPDTYIHRIGRTGRAERSGDAFTLVTPEDTAMVRQIERVLGAALERRFLPGFVDSEPVGAPVAGRTEPRRSSGWRTPRKQPAAARAEQPRRPEQKPRAPERQLRRSA